MRSADIPLLTVNSYITVQVLPTYFTVKKGMYYFLILNLKLCSTSLRPISCRKETIPPPGNGVTYSVNHQITAPVSCRGLNILKICGYTSNKFSPRNKIVLMFYKKTKIWASNEDIFCFLEK